MEIHDGDEECNPLDAPVKDEEDPLKIFGNPVKGEINDEEDPLQIPWNTMTHDKDGRGEIMGGRNYFWMRGMIFN